MFVPNPALLERDAEVVAVARTETLLVKCSVEHSGTAKASHNASGSLLMRVIADASPVLVAVSEVALVVVQVVISVWVLALAVVAVVSVCTSGSSESESRRRAIASTDDSREGR